ncbi:ATP-binding cassette domain-containing protein [Planctomycetota bacterium]|nr:ATP-binding cassette domain-containing protein [Planctomycetota bacterium]
MIEVEHLHKVYTGGAAEPVVAIEDVSFSARPGTIFGLLGPNGVGKTTTLRIIATVLTATSGIVRVDGADARTDPLEVRRRIGFLSTSTGLYERLNPRELLRYFGQLHGMEPARLEQRIEELVDTFEIGPFADRLCGVLSTGQKQRTSIARALLHDPPVVIFDEPTSGLDVVGARALVQRIASLKDARRTILLSTHIMHEAERLCDEVAILHKGRVKAAGSVAELKERTGTTNLEDAFFAATGADATDGAEEATHAG